MTGKVRLREGQKNRRIRRRRLESEPICPSGREASLWPAVVASFFSVCRFFEASCPLTLEGRGVAVVFIVCTMQMLLFRAACWTLHHSLATRARDKAAVKNGGGKNLMYRKEGSWCCAHTGEPIEMKIRTGGNLRMMMTMMMSAEELHVQQSPGGQAPPEAQEMCLATVTLPISLDMRLLGRCTA